LHILQLTLVKPRLDVETWLLTTRYSIYCPCFLPIQLKL